MEGGTIPGWGVSASTEQSNSSSESDPAQLVVYGTRYLPPGLRFLAFRLLEECSLFLLPTAGGLFPLLAPPSP